MTEFLSFWMKASAVTAGVLLLTLPDFADKTEESVKLYVSADVRSSYETAIVSWCEKRLSCTKMAEALYFEARGDGEKGMTAVANVIMNRAKANGKTPYDVIVKPHQFSYLSRKSLVVHDKENHHKSMVISAMALTGNLKDVTNGSTHYIAPKRLVRVPKWAKEMEKTVVVRDHQFFRG